LPELGGSLGDCEQCGMSLPGFEELVHHQFSTHLELFQDQADLFGDQPTCLCSSCSPGAHRKWLDEQPAASG
jgi:hypothetical protein